VFVIKKKGNEREWNAPGGQQLSWLKWRDIKWKYCQTHTISISGSVISLNIYIHLYDYLEQSTSFNLTIKISKQERRKMKKKSPTLSVICRYVEIHSCNLELHLVKKKRDTHNSNRVLLKMIRSRCFKKKVEDHHYRHHHRCVCIYTYVC
jgi:hypothetical protein